MEPFSLAGLVAAFLTAMFTSAGSAAGTRIVEVLSSGMGEPDDRAALKHLQAAPTEENQTALVSVLVPKLTADASFKLNVEKTLAQDLQSTNFFPGANEALESLSRAWDDLNKSFYGWSAQQSQFMRTRICPVGGERVWSGVSYLNHDGKELDDSDIKCCRAFYPYAEGVCPAGHRWPIFIEQS